VENVHCRKCEKLQTKTRWTEIVAAPKILRVHLQILHPQHKIFRHLSYPDLLDLTAHQQNRTLPLQYQLSSVIVHSGDYYTEEEASFMTALKIQEELDKQQQIESDHALALSLQRRGSDEGESEEGEESDQEELCRGTDDADPGSSALSSPGRSDLTEPPDGSISPAPSSPALSDLTGMSDTDLSALEKELYPPPEPLKVMVGHYISSMREHDDDAFSCINDSSVAAISRQGFLTNPQDSNGQKFEVYVLTYVRGDSVRQMPGPTSERWIKETTQLAVDKGAVEPVVYPTAEPPQPSRKRTAGQGGQQVTRQKRSKRS
jgi:hypothetical protein